MTEPYNYAPEDCDVEDRQLLEQFRSKRSTWVDWLDGDPHHAIWTTIHDLVWREVRFATIAEIADGNPGGALNNDLVGQSILEGHVALQVLAIRRLMDTTKGVISLARLSQDVRTNRKLLTRENYVCFDGLPYDYRRVMEEELRSRGPGVHWGHTSGPRAYSTSELAHRAFDRLSGVAPDNRDRKDRVRLHVFDRIDLWLKESGANDVSDWSHSYLAHAGSRARREALSDFGLGTKIKASIRELARVTEAISSPLLYIGGRMHALMPTAQYDQFEFLDKPAMKAGGLEAADAKWEAASDAYDGILSDVGEALFAP